MPISLTTDAQEQIKTSILEQSNYWSTAGDVRDEFSKMSLAELLGAMEAAVAGKAKVRDNPYWEQTQKIIETLGGRTKRTETNLSGAVTYAGAGDIIIVEDNFVERIVAHYTPHITAEAIAAIVTPPPEEAPPPPTTYANITKESLPTNRNVRFVYPVFPAIRAVLGESYDDEKIQGLIVARTAPKLVGDLKQVKELMKDGGCEKAGYFAVAQAEMLNLKNEGVQRQRSVGIENAIKVGVALGLVLQSTLPDETRNLEQIVNEAIDAGKIPANQVKAGKEHPLIKKFPDAHLPG